MPLQLSSSKEEQVDLNSTVLSAINGETASWRIGLSVTNGLDGYKDLPWSKAVYRYTLGLQVPLVNIWLATTENRTLT